MIYAPPYLIRRSVPKVKSIARSHRLRRQPREHTRQQTLESNQRASTLLLRGRHEQASTRRQHETSHYCVAPTVERVTNRLSGVLVTHDEYRTFTVVQVV